MGIRSGIMVAEIEKVKVGVLVVVLVILAIVDAGGRDYVQKNSGINIKSNNSNSSRRNSNTSNGSCRVEHIVGISQNTKKKKNVTSVGI